MEKVLSQEEISALFSGMSSDKRREENAQEEFASPADWEAKAPETMPCDQDAESMAELMMPLRIPMSGELRGFKLTMNALLRISVGDVIRLKDRVGDPMVLCIGGVPKFTGRILRRRGKKVFSILGRTTG
jgi:flagellar motor switch protein FliM